jgi:hypothetical protein
MAQRGGKREGSGRPAGAKNKRTAAIEAAALVVVERFKAEVPMAFDGDGVAFLQVVYRDPGQPIELRLDAAKAASRYERPALAATLTRDMTPVPATQAEGDQRIQALLRKGLGHVAVERESIDAGVGGTEPD